MALIINPDTYVLEDICPLHEIPISDCGCGAQAAATGVLVGSSLSRRVAVNGDGSWIPLNKSLAINVPKI